MRIAILSLIALVVLLPFTLSGCATAEGDDLMPGESKIAVTFTGGHEIGENDYGRPVVLIAAALKVKPDVFREAFSGVTPAHGRGPTGDEARKNKSALLKVLGPHGVTNERLDEVSNHYRFRPQNGELWTHSNAVAHAVVANGKIVRLVVTNPGSGYSTTPTATIDLNGVATPLKASIHLDTDLKKNGSVEKLELAKP